MARLIGSGLWLATVCVCVCWGGFVREVEGAQHTNGKGKELEEWRNNTNRHFEKYQSSVKLWGLDYGIRDCFLRVCLVFVFSFSFGETAESWIPRWAMRNCERLMDCLMARGGIVTRILMDLMNGRIMLVYVWEVCLRGLLHLSSTRSNTWSKQCWTRTNAWPLRRAKRRIWRSTGQTNDIMHANKKIRKKRRGKSTYWSWQGSNLRPVAY